MLLSKKAMKKVNMKPDMVNDKAEIYEQVVVLQNTSTVHYSVPLKEISVHIKDYFIVIEANENIVRVITKLHKKLCTPLQMVERGWWVMLIFLFQHADELAATCSICFKFKHLLDQLLVFLWQHNLMNMSLWTLKNGDK